ncbi:MAG TPA: collagen-like protein [Rhodothermales bacterium]|nr:collagen-like protein [Rhodothermales bacterium]
MLPLLLVACEGPVGPRGPEGEPGENGIDGRDGAANIQVVTFRMRESEFINLGLEEQMTLQMREIDQGIMDGGVVVVYTDFGTEGDTWYALPMTIPTEPLTINLSYALRLGFFTLLITKSQETTEKVASMFDFNQVRVITIPPVASKRAERWFGDVDYADYEAVARAYGL